MPKSLYLINPVGGIKGTPASLSGSAPPLALLSIATYLKESLSEIEVRVRDASVTSADEINTEITRERADLVAIGGTLWGYKKALEIAEVAKEAGATTILGGHHVSSVGGNVLKNRPFIDYVVRGEGEETLLALVRGIHPERVPNLVYRNGDKKPITTLDLQKLPIPSREFVEPYLKKYAENFREGMPSSPFSNFGTVYSHKGCEWREEKGPCIYCAISDKGVRLRNPEAFWNELKELKTRYGIEYVMDSGDSMPLVLLKRLAETKPEDADLPMLSLYARADSITPEYAELLQRVGAYSLFIGFESGNQEMLEFIGKGTSLKQNRTTAKILADHGIKIRAGFMLSLPGETYQSVDDTVNMAEGIIGNGNVEGISCLLLNPVPGSKAFRMLTSNGHAYLRNQDLFDPYQLEELWADKFAKVPYEELLERQAYVRSLAPAVNQ